VAGFAGSLQTRNRSNARLAIRSYVWCCQRRVGNAAFVRKLYIRYYSLKDVPRKSMLNTPRSRWSARF